LRVLVAFTSAQSCVINASSGNTTSATAGHTLRILTQVWCKACHIGTNLTERAMHTRKDKSVPPGSASHMTIIESAAQIVQTIGEALCVLNVLSQELESVTNGVTGMSATFGCYYCALLYWRLCGNLLSQLQADSPIPQPQHTFLYSRVHTAMLTTASTVEEFSHELQRLSLYRSDGTVFQCDARHLQLLADMLPPRIVVHSGMPDMTHCSFKLRFLFAGLDYVCGPLSASSENSTHIAHVNQQHKWVAALAEALISIVNKARSSGEYRLLPLAPYLAQRVLVLLTACSTHSLGSHSQWVFWELARVSDFIAV
jgi:hypothetical protein